MKKVGTILISAIGSVIIVGCASQPVISERSPAGSPDKLTAATVVSNSPSSTPRSVTLFEGVLAASKAAEPEPFEGEGWRNLFASFDGWREVRFAGGGEIATTNGLFLLNMGEPFTGIRFTNEFPVMNYEIAFDAMRVMGSDFFCGLTIPVGETHCSLVVGGWGGSLVGISSVDSMDASENQTTKFMSFEKGRWYRIRLRATKDRIEAWIGKDKVVDLVTRGRQISMRPGEIEMCKPLGIASWQTAAAFREIKWRVVETPADPPPRNEL